MRSGQTGYKYNRPGTHTFITLCDVTVTKIHLALLLINIWPEAQIFRIMTGQLTLSAPVSQCLISTIYNLVKIQAYRGVLLVV
jgi:hypothetical protein